MSLSPGSRLGPYEIFEKLGEGGMGQVFRGRDTRLDRIVAIKLLVPDWASTPEGRRRFQVEARSISALNHPNICTVFDVGEHSGRDFLVMEFLDGESLQSRLKSGPIIWEEARIYVLQILSALDHSHRRGILHRDLKPANIILVGSGSQRTAKLLDFGLAKAIAASGNDAETASLLTDAGNVMGTPLYLAPELLQGKLADQRSDLHAFGAVLYEMLTGQRAFGGDSKGNIYASILRDEPKSLSKLRPELPPVLDAVMSRCLAKSPDDRWQSAADLKAALELATGPVDTAPLPSLKRSPRPWLGIAAAAILFVAAGAALFSWLSETPPAEAIRFAVTSPPGFRLDRTATAPSPDGKTIAIVASAGPGEQALWLRRLRSENWEKLRGTEHAIGPFWSPDGRFVGFFAEGKAKRIEIATGVVQNICTAGTDLGATWNRDGDIILPLGNRVALSRVPSTGGEPQKLTTLDAGRQENSHRWPHFLPDGRHFLFTARSSLRENTVIRVGALDSKETKQLLLAQSNAVYVPSGYLLFANEGTLWAQKFDHARLELQGEPFAIETPISQITSSARAAFAASADGSVLTFQTGGHTSSQITWVDRKGAVLSTVGPPGDYTDIRLSPDGSKLAVVIPDKDTGNRDIWLMSLPSGTLTRFTFHPANDWRPTWSPDGSRIAFASDRNPQSSIYVKAVNGERDEKLLLTQENGVFPLDWSANGRTILYERNTPNSWTDLWALPLASDQKPFPLVATPARESTGQFSPDGKWMAYISDESGTPELYLKPVGRMGKQRVSTAGATSAVWRSDGREIHFISGDQRVMASTVAGYANDELSLSSPHPLFRQCGANTNLRDVGRNHDVTADGSRFLFACLSASPQPSFFTVHWNWQQGLQHRAK